MHSETASENNMINKYDKFLEIEMACIHDKGYEVTPAAAVTSDNLANI
jgi:hypothetical protein